MINPPAQLTRRIAFCLLLALVASTAVLSTGRAQPPVIPEQDKNKDKDKDTIKSLVPDEKVIQAFRKGDIPETLKLLREANKTIPNAAPAEMTLSLMFYQQIGNNNPNAGQMLALARQAIEQAFIERPDHPEVLITNALYGLREGRVTDAILSGQRALSASGSAAWTADGKKRFERESRMVLLQAYEARGTSAYPLMKEQVQALINADPQDATNYLRLAGVELAMDQPGSAFDAAKKAFELDKTIDPPELLIATLYQQRGFSAKSTPEMFAKAEEWFEKAVRIYGNAPPASPGAPQATVDAAKNAVKVQRGYAAYLLDRNQATRAKPYLDTLMMLEPNEAKSKRLRGLYLRHTHDYPEATKVFSELYARGDADFAGQLALCYAESSSAESKDQAVSFAQSYVRSNPQSAEAYAILAYTYLKRNDKQKNDIPNAEDAIRQASTKGNLSSDAIYIIAQVLKETGKGKEAHKALENAIKSPAPFVYRPEAQKLITDLPKPDPDPKDAKKP